MSALRVVAVILLVLAAARPASADTLVLKTGVSFEGQTISENDKEVVFKTEGASWTYARAKIASLTRTTAKASQPVSALPLSDKFQHALLAQGNGFSCAVRARGELSCWGHGTRGKPDGTGIFDARPHRVADGRWVSVAACGEDGLAVRADGSLWSFGWGEIAYNDKHPHPDQLHKFSGAVWENVSMSDQARCGVQHDGSLWCWGKHKNWGGILVPEREKGDRPQRIAEGEGSWLTVSLGGTSACGIKKNHSLWCWGTNGSGQVSDGTTQDRKSPAKVGDESDWVTVQMGPDGNGAFGLRADRSLWYWGSTDTAWSGFGDGVLRRYKNPTPAGTMDFKGAGARRYRPPAPGSGALDAPLRLGGESWTSVSIGNSHACGIRADSSVWCWGQNWQRQLGLDPDDRRPTAEPRPLQLDGSWQRVFAGPDRTCALDDEDDLYCWGDNSKGALGDGSTNGEVQGVMQVRPVKVLADK